MTQELYVPIKLDGKVPISAELRDELLKYHASLEAVGESVAKHYFHYLALSEIEWHANNCTGCYHPEIPPPVPT